jgi:GNAT superfamily N-acetyltransferase
MASVSPARLVVRRASVEDVNSLAMLNGFVQALHVASRPDVFRPPGTTQLARWFRTLLRKPDVRTWIAERDSRPVGYALATVHHWHKSVFFLPSRWWELDQIGVIPTHQRTGVGRALLDRLLDDARFENVSRVTLRSWAFNTEAHAAFQRWGFAPEVIEFGMKVP